MNVERGQDRCSECKTPLPDEGAYPDCASAKRFVSLSASIDVPPAKVTVDWDLIIGWQEVDRLFEKAEYAAALLVAAVNVEFILWEHLRGFTPASGLAAASDKVKSTWGQIRAGHSEMVSLSSLISVAECFTQNDKFRLSPPWDPLARDIDTVRNCIAHERAYFSLLTRLKVPHWSEVRIRQVLESAKKFCHGNAP